MAVDLKSELLVELVIIKEILEKVPISAILFPIFYQLVHLLFWSKKATPGSNYGIRNT